MAENDEWTRRRPDSWEHDDWGFGAAFEEEPSEAEASTANETSGNSRFGRKEFAALAAVGLLFGGSLAVAYHKRSRIEHKFRAAPAETLTPSCHQPGELAIATVERLFTEPVAKAQAEYRQQPLVGYEREGSLMLPNLWGTSGQELLYYTKDYFDKYGIDVEAVAGPDKNPGYGFRAPTQVELNSQNMSSNVLGIVAGLSEVPPHYVLESGLKKIRLVGGNHKTEFVWNEPDTLYWNIDTPEPNPDGVPFEFGIALGHFTEDRYCGQYGTESDEAFNAANSEPFASAIAPTEPVYGPEARPDTLYDYKEAKTGPEDVKIIDSRASGGISVDKAEIYALLAEPAQLSSALSPDHPILRAKTLEALAELYTRQPAVVRRLAVQAAHYPFTGPNANNKPAGTRHDSRY